MQARGMKFAVKNREANDLRKKKKKLKSAKVLTLLIATHGRFTLVLSVFKSP